MTSLSLHTLEAQSVRVSATLDARPELGALWRRLVAVTEASANLSMEDVPVPEQDILMPDLESSSILGDPQAARMARAIYSFLLRPGNLLERPEEVFDRALEVGRIATLVDEEEGGRVGRLSHEEREDWALARDDFGDIARSILRHDAPVIFRLLAFSGIVSQFLPDRVPIAERLLFVAAEHTIRKQECLSGGIVGLKDAERDFRTHAYWTMTPALALTRNGFRAWSPASDMGTEDLVKRLQGALEFNVGRLTKLNKWMLQLEGFTGQTRKSRRKDLADLVLKCPIINTETAAKRLDITPRATRDLIEAATQEGIVELMTPRKNYRIWAVPTLAEMIRERPSVTKRATGLPRLQDLAPPPAPNPYRNRKDSEAAIEAAAAKLDEAMAKADRILAKYRRDATPD